MKSFVFNADNIRRQFPAMATTVAGKPAIFLDAPGGTQTPNRVVGKVADYLYYHNSNSHGQFVVSQESDDIYWKARETFGEFFNCAPEEVIFGANATSNNLRMAATLSRIMKPGDEILLTDIDHEANRSPWAYLADYGVVIKSVAVDGKTCQLDFEDFKKKLSSKTKLLAINWASNACGTITDVKRFIDEAHKVGALVAVDAVHYAPHRWIDVKAIDCDMLSTSTYKYFGPHFGAMYVRKELGDKLNSVRVMVSDYAEMPYKLEAGTPAIESAAGAAEAIRFIADIGADYAPYFEEELGSLSGLRRNIVAGMMAIDYYEEGMAAYLRKELRSMDGVTVYGPEEGMPRTSTVSFAVRGIHALDMAKYLADEGIFVWESDFYVPELVYKTLGLEPVGGLVRLGLAPYNLPCEMERAVAVIRKIVTEKAKH